MKNKPKVELYGSVGTGLIVIYPTGILFSNQTGGIMCLQPQIEGFYLPIGNDYISDSKILLSPETELTNYFLNDKYFGGGAIDGIDLNDVENINKILIKFHLNNFIKIDLEKLTDSHEAWIFVDILNIQDFGLMHDFEYPLKGVLTWGNSD